MMKVNDPDFNLWLRNQLRRISYKWTPRNVVFINSRVARGEYKCCQCSNIVSRSEIKIDHIKPVIDPKNGFESWDEFITRLFCNEDGLQALCKHCHDIKSAEENVIRRKTKKKQLKKKGRKNETRKVAKKSKRISKS